MDKKWIEWIATHIRKLEKDIKHKSYKAEMAILPAEMYAAIVETNTEETNEIVKKLWGDAWTVAYYAGCAFFRYTASQCGEAETVGIRRSADYFARTLAAYPDACNRSINKWIQCSHKFALLLRICVYCPTLLLPLLKALNTSNVRLYFFSYILGHVFLYARKCSS